MLSNIGLFVLVIILLVVSYYMGVYMTEMNTLGGFWETNAEFNLESGLSAFTFYIGDKRNGEYSSYLLMMKDDTILINEPLVFTITGRYDMFKDYREFILRFKKLESDILPSIMKMRFYPQNGKILLLDHDKIYAMFFKNPVLSELDRIKKCDEKKNKNISI